MDFAQAFTLLKDGHLVARKNWSGYGMFVVRQQGYPDGIAINGNTAQATKLDEGTVCRFQPYMMIRNRDGSFVPWTPSQTDLFAEDWQRA
ncbi:DUF2829 domain-containing protein [Streptomyces sp. NPDC005551]|uniref:DUF2829 domain-containing protein n=1 Tax=Streptomyces sp. NPDC005551 TaxID=3364725 RepID=UPI00368D12AB